jgi:Flp pilus assembly pilin Flp
MRQMLSKLWNDDCGALIATEWVFFVTILVLGIITGLIAVRQGIKSELTEVAQAIMALNQSYSFSGEVNCESSTGGSSATDTTNTISETSVAASTALVNQNPCD